MTTAELASIGKEILERHAVRSPPPLAYGFPGITCISVNDQLARGIPSPTCVLRAGDLVDIDVSAELDGYWADTGASFPVGTVSAQGIALLRATRLALEDGMLQARAGAPLRNIGRAVERRAKRHGFRVVRNLCGHYPRSTDRRDMTASASGRRGKVCTPLPGYYPLESFPVEKR